MKKLEKQIVNKMYSFETKKTLLEIMIRTGVVLIATIFGMYFLMVVIRQLIEQRTLDVLELFQEDAEIIRNYAREAFETIYQEFPKYEFALSIFMFLVGLFFILLFLKNFKKIKNKLFALKKYWQTS